jgi:hypothetical protein
MKGSDMLTAEEQAIVDRRTPEVERILANEPQQQASPQPGSDPNAGTQQIAPAAPARRPRSDKGTTRPVKPSDAPAVPVATAGGITEAQWVRLGVLVELCVQATLNLRDARARSDEATAAYRTYLDSLRAPDGTL